ncbi:MAG TPA: response regulator [Burkholderiales bacterium]|nr:response regulator [Burkholderiales bacterium]
MDLEDTDNLTIFAPTDKGRKELKAGSTSLSAIALELMVMFDGKTPMAAISKRVSGARSGEIGKAVEGLLKNKLIDVVKPGATMEHDFGSFFEVPIEAMPDSVSTQFRDEAEKGLQSLDRTGYYIGVARQATATKAPSNGTRYAVLMIEDNAPFITAVKMLLKLEGYEVRVATSRDEIVAALRGAPLPDAILLDVNLPGTDGFSILARIRQHPSLKAIPVIMLTAQASRGDVLRGLSAGANGYITKPFEHEALMSSLRAVLGVSEQPAKKA